MRKLIIPAVLIAVLGLCLPAYAQFAKVGTVGLKFLDIGVGGRALAMGEAYSAVANDASAIFWNPAGIANVKENDFFMAIPTGLPISICIPAPLSKKPISDIWARRSPSSTPVL